MSPGQFLRCRDCEVVFRSSPHDRAPEYRPSAEGYAEGYTEVARDDLLEFLTRHARHRLESLRPCGDPVWCGEGIWDATAHVYWPVSNGGEPFVVEGWRDGVGQPMRYRTVPGRLATETASVEIPFATIRELLDRALYPGAAPERKLAAFLQQLAVEVRGLDPASLELLYQLPTDPERTVARLPGAVRDRLRRSAAAIFDEAELDHLAPLFDATGEHMDALALVVRQRVRIEGG